MATRKDESGLRPIALLAASLARLGGDHCHLPCGCSHREPESRLLRAAMVALGVGGFLSWIVSVARA